MSIERNNFYNKELRDRAKGMRNAATSISEKFLWKSLLSRKQLGIGFKRQRPIGNYIVDFFAAEIQLIIEVDRNAHMQKSDYDRRRQDWLINQGYTVLRYTEKEVLHDFHRVKMELVHAVYCLSPET